MSLKSWKAEFYPVRAVDVSKENAIEHSLQKWIGAREENVEKHGCTYQDNMVYDTDAGATRGFGFTDTTCALCVRYWTRANRCSECPLSKSRGGIACDNSAPGEDVSPYEADSPEPMIAALIKAKEYEHVHRPSGNDVEAGKPPPRTEDPVAKPGFGD